RIVISSRPSLPDALPILVNQHWPITGSKIAAPLSLTRPTLRPDLAILTMSGSLDARPRVGYFYTGKETNDVIALKVNNILVRDVQSLLILITTETSIYDAIVKMFMDDVGTLYVIDDEQSLSCVISSKC